MYSQLIIIFVADVGKIKLQLEIIIFYEFCKIEFLLIIIAKNKFIEGNPS